LIEWLFKNCSKKSHKPNKSILMPNSGSKVPLLSHQCSPYTDISISRHPSYCVCRVVVIINEADSLSRDAQAALRRTMEKYMSNMRIILCANSTSRLIAPIKSRCLLMRVAAPTSDEVRTIPVHTLYQFRSGELNLRRRCIRFLHISRKRRNSTFLLR
jgi:hypothetical protein